MFVLKRINRWRYSSSLNQLVFYQFHFNSIADLSQQNGRNKSDQDPSASWGVREEV